MSNTIAQDNRIDSEGGPKLKSGKDRSRSKPLKDGRYAKQLTAKVGLLKELARKRREILESLLASLAPKDAVGLIFVETAADAKARETEVVLGEKASIQMHIEEVLEKYQRIEFERYKEQSYALELEEELALLVKERENGFDWERSSRSRIPFLLAAVQNSAGSEAALEFRTLSLPDERKSFFQKKLSMDDRAVLSSLINSITHAVEVHQSKAEELSRQVEYAERSGQKQRDLARASILTGVEAEFVRSSLGGYRRQFDNAIESFRRHCASTL